MNTQKRSYWNYLFIFFIALAFLGAINKYFISGEHAFGATPDVPWGTLIAGYVFFAVAATGTGLVGSLGHVFRIQKFEVLSKRALLASILLLVAAFAVLAVELANPFKMIWLLFTPNLSSPIFWMGAFYGIYLVLLFAEFFFTLKEKHSAATGIAYVSFIVKLCAVINLGRVFSFSITRDFWYGYYYPAYMVMTAIVSGAAVLTLIVYLIGKDSAKFDVAGKNIALPLSKILAVALILLAIMQGAKIGLSLASDIPIVAQAASALISGPKALNFWLMEIFVGIILPLGILVASKFSSVGKGALAAALTMVGLLFSRLDFVYTGQAVPLPVVGNTTMIAEVFNSYSATWSEWSLIIGALGFVLLVFRLAEGKLVLDSKH